MTRFVGLAHPTTKLEERLVEEIQRSPVEVGSWNPSHPRWLFGISSINSSWWFQPIWNILYSQNRNFPNRGENKRQLKSPPSSDDSEQSHVRFLKHPQLQNQESGWLKWTIVHLHLRLTSLCWNELQKQRPFRASCANAANTWSSVAECLPSSINGNGAHMLSSFTSHQSKSSPAHLLIAAHITPVAKQMSHPWRFTTKTKNKTHHSKHCSSSGIIILKQHHHQSFQ